MVPRELGWLLGQSGSALIDRGTARGNPPTGQFQMRGFTAINEMMGAGDPE